MRNSPSAVAKSCASKAFAPVASTIGFEVAGLGFGDAGSGDEGLPCDPFEQMGHSGCGLSRQCPSTVGVNPAEHEAKAKDGPTVQH